MEKTIDSCFIVVDKPTLNGGSACGFIRKHNYSKHCASEIDSHLVKKKMKRLTGSIVYISKLTTFMLEELPGQSQFDLSVEQWC